VDQEASAGRQQVIALVLTLIYPVSFLWNLKKDAIVAELKTASTLSLVVLTLSVVVGAILSYLLLAPRVNRWFRRAADLLRRKGW
jgi:hypothetical protein